MLKSQVLKNGYNIVVEYRENEKEAIFFVRDKKNVIQIWEMIHIKKYHNQELEYFNEQFAGFWKMYMAQKKMFQCVEFIFILCVDEETKELKKFFEACTVHPSKERCVFPIFMLRDFYDEYYEVSVEINAISKKYRKRYSIMQKEIKEIMDI